MIIQIGTEADESRILWKHKESDEWKRADIDDLIEAYENRQKEPKPGDLISRQALMDEILEEGNGAVLSYPAGMYEDDLVEHIEKQMIQHFIGVIEYVSQVEPKSVEDAISRQDLSDKVGRYYEERGDFGSFECFWILDAIRNAPPVEPINLQPTCNRFATDLISRQAAIEAVERAVLKDGARSAIESLPPVEPVAKNATPTEDCISRQSAINAIENINAIVRPISESDDVFLVDKAEAMTELTMLPSAQPKRPKGKYIKGQNGEYYCSVCKRIDDKYSVARHCWYCGADMRGKEK